MPGLWLLPPQPEGRRSSRSGSSPASPTRLRPGHHRGGERRRGLAKIGRWAGRPGTATRAAFPRPKCASVVSRSGSELAPPAPHYMAPVRLPARRRGAGGVRGGVRACSHPTRSHALGDGRNSNAYTTRNGQPHGSAYADRHAHCHAHAHAHCHCHAYAYASRANGHPASNGGRTGDRGALPDPGLVSGARRLSPEQRFRDSPPYLAIRPGPGSDRVHLALGGRRHHTGRGVLPGGGI